MQQANINGITLECEDRGSGEPVVFIHGSGIADTFAPMVGEPALKDFRLIRYHRRGYMGSSAVGVLPISGEAADCRALLGHLGVGQAHVVGHSYGAVTAIQLALDSPDLVRSLALLEPPLTDVPSGPALLEGIGRAAQSYMTGDAEGAVDAFLQAVCGKGYRVPLDAAVPGGFEQAVTDAQRVFVFEGAALTPWTFTRDAAVRITQPVLAVLGADSGSVWAGWVEGHQRLLDWLPNARPFVLPRATHLLQVQNSHDMAEGLAAFLNTN